MPLQALVHRRHALLIRESDRDGSYRVVPLANADVRVNGDRVVDSRRLADGEVLQFGTDQCRWSFRLPVPGSATALLVQARPATACVRTGDGRQVRTVVLLTDELRIGREPGADQLFESALPGRLRFWWRGGLCVTAEQGALFVADGREEESIDRPLRLPAELTLYDDRPGIQIVGGAFAGAGGPATAKLRLT